jgi:hypothetical protein
MQKLFKTLRMQLGRSGLPILAAKCTLRASALSFNPPSATSIAPICHLFLLFVHQKMEERTASRFSCVVDICWEQNQCENGLPQPNPVLKGNTKSSGRKNFKRWKKR